jgi:hypothetical protein
VRQLAFRTSEIFLGLRQIVVQQRAKELFRGLFVASALHQDVKDVVVLIHRPP